MFLTVKKVNYIFKLLNLNIIADKVFFASGIPGEKRAKLKKIGRESEQQTEVGSTIPLDIQNTFIIFLSAIAVMQVFFELKINPALFLIAGINSKANKRAKSYFL